MSFRCLHESCRFGCGSRHNIGEPSHDSVQPGLHQVARLVSQEAHYLVFKDPVKAWKAFHEIRNDSLAIGVHLYYAGLVGEAAEHKLDAHAHGRD